MTFINPIALRKAKKVYNFGLSESKRVSNCSRNYYDYDKYLILALGHTSMNNLNIYNKQFTVQISMHTHTKHREQDKYNAEQF